MKSGVLLLTLCTVFAHNNERTTTTVLPRLKRGAVGALHIVTNHAQPIHADVKPEVSADGTEKGLAEKPCPNGSVPSHIEPGVGFKVTAPDDTFITYEMKSLRKSLPYTPPTALDLTRSISRIITLLVLFVSAVLEFYPTFYSLICTIISFVNTK